MTREQYQQQYGSMPEVKPEAPQETKATRGFASGLAIGVGKSIGETAVGVGQIGTKVLDTIGGAFGQEDFGSGSSIYAGESLAEMQSMLEASGKGEGTGKFLGTLAQYMIPNKAIVGGQQALGKVASQAPKGLGLVSKGLARFAPEAIGTGAVSAVRSGGDLQESGREGTTAGLFSVGFGALGGLARKTYFPNLKESVTKALGIQGQRSGGQALEEVNKKIAGMGVLAEKAKNITVKNADGLEVSFNPKNATYNTTLQAWNKTRQNIYNQYSGLAKKAGESTTVDLDPVIKGLNDALNQPGLSAFKNPTARLIQDIRDSFADPRNVGLEDAQRFVEQINKQTVSGFFKGTADSAVSEVNAGVSRAMRELMDSKIMGATGGEYQKLRTQYASLKAVENDLVRKFQQEARSIGGGLSEYMGMFSSGDILGSLLSGSGVGLVRGTAVGILAGLKRKLSKPERFLQRSFELLDRKESQSALKDFFGDVKSRAFGTEPTRATNPFDDFVNSIQKKVKNYKLR